MVPDGTLTIRKGQFSNQNYERMFIPMSVVEILDNAFSGWKSIKEVIFEYDCMLKKIGREAFD